MSFELQKEQLAALIPGNKDVDAWHAALVEVMPKYGINTERRAAHFISQCAHESGNFRTLEENLNYSEKALNAVFGRYFGAPPKRNAAEYARNPEKIANYVYQDEFRSKGGQMGNVKDGDGWLFRGRGLKQLTGRNNYTGFGKSIGMTAEEAAEYVATPKGALESACWFWATNKLEKFADANDNLGLTKRINGGTIGLDDRNKRFEAAKAILGGELVSTPRKSATSEAASRTLRRGMKGDDVARMQKALGVAADGDFGPSTLSVVKKWQRANGLEPDGIVGPRTQAKMFG